MPTELLSDFDAHPWAIALLSSPSHINLTTPTRRQPPPVGNVAPARFMSKTMWTDKTVRARQVLCTKDVSDRGVSPEYLLLCSLGEDMDGWQNKLQGGLISFLIDYTASMCATTEVKDKMVLTGEMKLKYKKAVPVPGIVLCTAVVKRKEGRKRFIETVLEDGRGGVYAEGEVVFVEKREGGKL